jgi:hypothetical protein
MISTRMRSPLGRFAGNLCGLIRFAIAVALPFTPPVIGANRPEEVCQIPDQSGTYGAPLRFTAPTNALTLVDAKQSGTFSVLGLPPGIVFDANRLMFSGTPQLAGTFSVQIMAAGKNNPATRRAIGSFTFTVNKAPLTIIADDKTMVDGGRFPLLTATYVGFVNGDTSANLDRAGAFMTSATPRSQTGEYQVGISGTADSNYEIKFVSGTLRVTSNNLWMAAQGETKGYNTSSTR